jgi:hypothetical protein
MDQHRIDKVLATRAGESAGDAPHDADPKQQS